MSKKYHITTTVNGDDYEYLCEAQQTLLAVLRDTGTVPIRSGDDADLPFDLPSLLHRLDHIGAHLVADQSIARAFVRNAE